VASKDREVPKTDSGAESALKDPGFHRFGSSGLTKLVKENEDSIVVHIHGHCHDGAFVDRVKRSKFQVVNPGSIAEGEYGVITLLKS